MCLAQELNNKTAAPIGITGCITLTEQVTHAIEQDIIDIINCNNTIQQSIERIEQATSTIEQWRN